VGEGGFRLIGLRCDAVSQEWGADEASYRAEYRENRMLAQRGGKDWDDGQYIGSHSMRSRSNNNWPNPPSSILVRAASQSRNGSLPTEGEGSGRADMLLHNMALVVAVNRAAKRFEGDIVTSSCLGGVSLSGSSPLRDTWMFTPNGMPQSMASY
jgi:hypothetical protein